ncbi:unnamed protein product [Oikopleura dioica]|uniref:Uncharacterized protein n=1 Tax=Oikopleura dioica TaxID=34765 RepID=E4X9Z1_OIKDI|nr:unnamed protein product [Oikopleura dioica]
MYDCAEPHCEEYALDLVEYINSCHARNMVVCFGKALNSNFNASKEAQLLTTRLKPLQFLFHISGI